MFEHEEIFNKIISIKSEIDKIKDTFSLKKNTKQVTKSLLNDVNSELDGLTDTFKTKFNEVDKENFFLKSQLTIAKVLGSTLNLERILESVSYTCIGLFTASTTSIFLPKDIDDPSLTLYYCKGHYEENDLVLDLVNDNTLISFFNEKDNNRAFPIEVLKRKKKFSSILKQLDPLAPRIISPLLAKNKVNGVLMLGEKINKIPYDDDDLVFITNLSVLAGLAVENARLYEMATMDRMTKLFIHHYFQTRLLEEISKSIKFKNELSLILIDIDHFKDVNDTYGHQQGDLVLKEFSKIIRTNIRPEDIPARYGGEEFTIILPNMNKAQAEDIAENLRSTIEKHKFHLTQEDIHITASFGVASYDYKNPIPKEDFIEIVDRAMYKSKNQGRNRVTVI